MNRLAEQRADVRQPLRRAAARRSTRLASFFTMPETTLKYVTRPANGSAMVLKTNAEAGSESFDLRARLPRR